MSQTSAPTTCGSAKEGNLVKSYRRPEEGAKEESLAIEKKVTESSAAKTSPSGRPSLAARHNLPSTDTLIGRARNGTCRKEKLPEKEHCPDRSREIGLAEIRSESCVKQKVGPVIRPCTRAKSVTCSSRCRYLQPAPI